QPAKRGHAVPQGRRHLPAARQPEPTHESPASRPRRGGLGGVGPRAGDEPRGRAREEVARGDLHRAARGRRAGEHDARHFLARRRQPRQRREPHPSRAYASAPAGSPEAIRARSQRASPGGLLNYVMDSSRWLSQSFFQTCVLNYSGASTIVSDEFKDAKYLNGVFSGLAGYSKQIKEWPLNA